MLNLLHTTLSEAEIAGALGDPDRPLAPKLGSAEWARVSRSPVAMGLVSPLVEQAERERTDPLPPLPSELYADYHATGNRLRFERIYFERRRRLARAVCAALTADAADRAHWIESVVAKLRDIASEVSWALPAHAGNPAGQDPQVLDLFCAETAYLMGSLLVVFGDDITGDLQASIRQRVYDQIFTNYIDYHERFHWRTATSNWNAVCHQGVVGTALAVADSATAAKIVALAVPGLRTFLSGFGADGGCTEGPGYWSYGFGWFSGLNDELEMASRGELSLFDGDDHIRQIALYGKRVSLRGGNLVNFADCAEGSLLSPSHLRYLGRRLGEPSLIAQGNENYRILLAKGISYDAERADVFNITPVLLDVAADEPLNEGEASKASSSFYFADLAVLVVSSADKNGHWWDFAAKGGHNEEHHNHNDCGSYLVNIDGQPLIIEIGAPEYTKDTFGPNRYADTATRTLGHSLPIVNGQEQSEGREFAAKIVAHEVTDTLARFVVDLTNCYPSAAGLLKLTRRFTLNRAAGNLTVTDDFTLTEPGDFETSIITRNAVQQDAQSVRLVGETVTANVVVADGARIAAIETLRYSNHDGHESTVQRIVVRPSVVAMSGSVTYTVWEESTPH